MAKPELPPLSEAQLEIINIVWDQGTATVGQVLKVLSKRRPLSRNTVSTMVTRLEEEGMVAPSGCRRNVSILGHAAAGKGLATDGPSARRRSFSGVGRRAGAYTAGRRPFVGRRS